MTDFSKQAVRSGKVVSFVMGKFCLGCPPGLSGVKDHIAIELAWLMVEMVLIVGFRPFTAERAGARDERPFEQGIRDISVILGRQILHVQDSPAITWIDPHIVIFDLVEPENAIVMNSRVEIMDLKGELALKNIQSGKSKGAITAFAILGYIDALHEA